MKAPVKLSKDFKSACIMWVLIRLLCT
jgi:hypothetical protein